MLLGCVFAGSLGLLPGRFANLVTGGSSGTTTQSETLPAAQAPTVAPAAPVSNVSTSAQGGGNAATAPSAAVSSAPVQGAQGALITPYTSPAFYIVRPSDTLDGVAAMFGTTADALSTYNRLTSDALLIGQVLYLPPVAYNPVPDTGRNAGHDTQAPANNDNGDQ